MPLVTSQEMMEDARRNGYAIGAFNVDSLEAAEAVVEAAEALRSPAIVSVGQGFLKQSNWAAIAAMLRALLQSAKVPLALHLDHGSSFEQAVRCMHLGFTSVMVDGSHLPFEENIRLVADTVKTARPLGIPVEGELGQVGGAEDLLNVDESKAGLTDPELVEPFVQATGLTSLAIAIGTAHGKYKGEPKIRFDLLDQIRRRTSALLVLHGGSGLSDEIIRRAIAKGICKINVATELRIAYTQRAAQIIRPDDGNVLQVSLEARKAVQAVVAEKIRLFGSANRA